jgi:hypothetical protein
MAPVTTPAPLRRPLLLTGPPGVGRRSVAAELCRRRSLCAVVEVDAVRRMVRAGGVPPWVVGAGEGQHRLAAVQGCLLASSFVAAGVEVVLTDVVRGPIGQVYRTSTAAPLIVALRAPLEVVRVRAAAHADELTRLEFEALHAEAMADVSADAVVDTTGLDLAGVVTSVDALWAGAGATAPST